MMFLTKVWVSEKPQRILAVNAVEFEGARLAVILMGRFIPPRSTGRLTTGDVAVSVELALQFSRFRVRHLPLRTPS